MKSSTIYLAASIAAPSLVSAHGFVTGVKVNNGAWTAGSDPVWYYYASGTAPATAGWDALNQDIGFVEPSRYGTADIAFYWNTWADSHKGPAINYIAPYGTSANNLKWSKISQSSIVSGTTWVTDQMFSNNFTLSTTIPRNLKAGDYVIRHEIIALHGAQNVGGAQNYPQCLNLRVSGSGSVSPTNGVPGTSLYQASEQGIVFNLYTGYSSYPYPGPALWTAAN